MSAGPARTSCNRPCTIWPLSVTGGIASPQVISVSRDARHNVIVLTLRVTRKRAWAVPWKLLVLAVETVAGVPFYIRKPFKLGEPFPSFSNIFHRSWDHHAIFANAVWSGEWDPCQRVPMLEDGTLSEVDRWIRLNTIAKKVEFSSLADCGRSWLENLGSIHCMNHGWIIRFLHLAPPFLSPLPRFTEFGARAFGRVSSTRPILGVHRLTWSMTTAIQRRSNAMKKSRCRWLKDTICFFCLCGSWTMVLGSAWNNLNLKAIRQSPGVFYAAPLMARRGGAGYTLTPKPAIFQNGILDTPLGGLKITFLDKAQWCGSFALWFHL